jgi:tetratricopeptide (TPR) repeat protein
MKLAGGLLMVALLSACSATESEDGPPQDQTLMRHEEAGKIAFGLERPEVAVAQFHAALIQAQARDDPTAIVELSFNLAVAQLKANQPQDALESTREASAELRRRGRTPSLSLMLAEATALYRLGRFDDADVVAAQVEAAKDGETASGASFLRGLIADESGDEAGLRDALARLSNADEPLRLADRLELQARLALKTNDLGGARAAAQKAAEIRQETLDYRGMARALALAGKAAELSGDNETAADLYLRAGRSAAIQQDAETARPWLQRVVELTRSADTAAAATRAMAGLQ